MSLDEDFADVLEANRAFTSGYEAPTSPPKAAKGLAVLTCMDARVDPAQVLGLGLGEAMILRNAGARVTDDVVRGLVVAAHLLQVSRVMVLAHTKCRMGSSGDEELHEAIGSAGGPDTRSLSLLAAADQEAALRGDVQRMRSSPYLAGVTVGGFRYDMDTGRVTGVC